MVKKTFFILSCIALFGILFVPSAFGGAAKTTYPVVLAHGMGGFDDILGYGYWSNDGGYSITDPCDKFLECACNEDIDDDQEFFIASVTPFESSHVRGLELANEIENYMTAKGVSHVNIISHSQGGLDMRKAAAVLRARKGYQVVKVATSISSPHRGTPVAEYIYNLNDGVTDVVATLAEYYGDIVYGSGNDGYAAVKQFIPHDADPNDGEWTGTERFNQLYPVNSGDIGRYTSFITAQDGVDVNPALYLLKEFFYDIPGDDDGLVPVTSQQVGYRLEWDEYCCGIFDYTHTNYDLGHVSDIENPTYDQQYSMNSVVVQDHLDVIGVGPDCFDEPEFYAALVDYIAYFD